jgi:hypothetical protein
MKDKEKKAIGIIRHYGDIHTCQILEIKKKEKSNDK